VSYTRAQLRDRVRQRADLENTSAQVDAELNDHINEGAAYWHDFLIGVLGERYSLTTVSGSTVAGTSSYNIGSAMTFNCTDFYRPINARVTFDSLSFPLAAFNPVDEILSTASTSWGADYLPRYAFEQNADGTNKILFDPPPDQAYSITIKYHPAEPVYTAESGAGGVIYMPFPEGIIYKAAIEMKTKERQDASSLEKGLMAIQKRVEDWVGSVDMGEPWTTLRMKSGGHSRWRRDRIF